MNPHYSIEKPCCICHKAAGSGDWALCDGCRRRLAERSAERQARMAPSYCMACQKPKRTAPRPGSIYCPLCTYRFHGKAAKA